MNNLAILSLTDFENWNNPESTTLGGSTGVIKSILPYLVADHIYLLGLTSDKQKLNTEIFVEKNISILPIAYISKSLIIPTRLLSFWYSRKINSVLRKYHIHFVYSHAEEMSYWIKPGITLLYHMHGATNALTKAKIKLFRNRALQILWEYIRKQNIKKANKIIVIDQYCYDVVNKYNHNEKALFIPNFVDINVYYKSTEISKLINQIDKKILLFVGRIEEVKGLKLFVDTLLELNDRKTGEWTGVFVGSGTFEAELRKYITNKCGDHLFYFTGPVFDQDELRRIYNKATILMISSFFEGIPMAILESLACGTPIISTNVGGIRDLIADNKMCFVIDSRDPKEFADSIESILAKDEVTTSTFKFSAERASVIINDILSK